MESSTPQPKTKDCFSHRISVVETFRTGMRTIDRIYGSRFVSRNFRSPIVREFLNLKYRAGKPRCKDLIRSFKFLTAGMLDCINEGWENAKNHPLYNGFKIQRGERRKKNGQPFGKVRVRSRSVNRKWFLTVASALVSLKKRLPTPCSCLAVDIEEKTLKLLSEEDREISEEYLNFCDVIVDELDYKRNDLMSYVNSFTLGLGSCQGSSRSVGGTSKFSDFGREWFTGFYFDKNIFDEIEGGSENFVNPIVNYTLVISKGKARGVTINDILHQTLSPLHNLLYDVLSRQEWLLRGTPSAKKLNVLLQGREDDDLMVSGDYESATDNLTIVVAERLLRRFMERYNQITNGLKINPEMMKFAVRSLRTTIVSSSGMHHTQKRGQLMGSLLSFPLLCLQNYVAYRYFLHPEKPPVKINGDDILARLKPHQYRKWSDGVLSVGLKLSSGKTFKHPFFSSINSTYFWIGEGKIELLPVARLGELANTAVLQLGQVMKDFLYPFEGTPYRKEAVNEYVKYHKSYFRMFEEADISITRPIPFGMGVRLTVGELADLGFLKWETRVRQLPMKKIPLVPVDNGFGCPPGMMWEVSSSPSRSTIDSVGIRWDQKFKKPSKRIEDSQGRNVAEKNKLSSRARLSGNYVEYEAEDVVRFCPSSKRGNKRKKK